MTMIPTVSKSTNRELGRCMCCADTRHQHAGPLAQYEVYVIDLGETVVRICDEHLLDLREAIVQVAGRIREHRERFPD
jgi:hypothetical protein